MQDETLHAREIHEIAQRYRHNSDPHTSIVDRDIGRLARGYLALWSAAWCVPVDSPTAEAAQPPHEETGPDRST